VNSFNFGSNTYLQGADIIVNSTNLPSGSESFIETLLPARALENRVFMIAASRVGMERGMSFIGASSIVDPYGRFLGEGLYHAIVDNDLNPDYVLQMNIARFQILAMLANSMHCCLIIYKLNFWIFA